MNRFSSKQLLAAAVTTAFGVGCFQASFPGQDSSDTGILGDGGINTPKPDMAVDIKAEFDAKVKNLLVGDCGQCHSQQSGGVGPGFLYNVPDTFTTVTSFPGLIATTPEASRILLKDPHAGPSYHASASYTPPADLAAHATIISDWIKLYNQIGGKGALDGVDMGAKTRIMPFVPNNGETKMLDLGAIDPTFAGATVSFTVSMVGATQIKLSSLTLTAAAGKGVHIKTPVFATYAAADPNVAIDINYDYLDKDFTAFPGTSVTFSPSLVIFGYTGGQLLGLSFNTLDNPSGSADMGPAVGMCKNLAGFQAFKPQLTGSAGLNCPSCHNGGNGGFSTNGFATAANDAASCAQALANSVPATPTMSALNRAVDGASGINHTGGKLPAAALTTFQNGLSTWLTGEK